MRSGRRRPARQEVEDHLEHPERDDTGELPGEQRPVAKRGQREPVDEAVWMSRARSVPAFIVEKSAPWMNGTASANARNESVGKPGRLVDERKTARVHEHERQGKISGGMTLAG